jgi:hypothetical protein
MLSLLCKFACQLLSEDRLSGAAQLLLQDSVVAAAIMPLVASLNNLQVRRACLRGQPLNRCVMPPYT